MYPDIHKNPFSEAAEYCRLLKKDLDWPKSHNWFIAVAFSSRQLAVLQLML
jgi:hypothetical protein